MDPELFERLNKEAFVSGVCVHAHMRTQEAGWLGRRSARIYIQSLACATRTEMVPFTEAGNAEGRPGLLGKTTMFSTVAMRTTNSVPLLNATSQLLLHLGGVLNFSMYLGFNIFKMPSGLNHTCKEICQSIYKMLIISLVFSHVLRNQVRKKVGEAENHLEWCSELDVAASI